MRLVVAPGDDTLGKVPLVGIVVLEGVDQVVVGVVEAHVCIIGENEKKQEAFEGTSSVYDTAPKSDF